ncbi:MAG: FliM/FliN family flagellar motor C-terminal domain-containing protein [Rhodobacteraceae bacterium]|nr:FliM/FliN family flagellar motor C-terminal domain-containing protein [Paracoccaceae bacterium]
MRRKLEGAQAATAARELAVLKALRLGLARSAADQFDLPLSVIDARQQVVSQDALGDLLPRDHMLLLLEGPQGATGAAAVSLTLVGALIQQQTMGKVSRLATPDRACTATDAAMCAPLIEDVLRRAAAAVEFQPEKTCLSGRRYGALAEDARALLLSLDAPGYRCFHLGVDIALGLHRGDIAFFLPEPPAEPAPADARDAEGDTDDDNPMLAVQAELTAVLCKLRIPLSDLTALAPGDLLALPPDRLSQTRLISLSNRTVATVILGQMNGNRAVKLAAAGPVPAAAPAAARADGGADPDDFEPAGPWQGDADEPPMVQLPMVVAPEGAVSGDRDSNWPSMDLPDLPPMSDIEATAMQDGDADSGFNPSEMALEISQLAGLDPGDTEDNRDD